MGRDRILRPLDISKRKEENPIVSKKNLVGTSNRNTFEWHPVSLLCKRMNVPNPYPNSELKGAQSVLKSKSVFQHLTFDTKEAKISKETDSAISPSSINLESKIESSKDVSNDIQSEVPEAPLPVKSNENVPPVNQRPPMDFFKDIFENSSSEDDEEAKESQDNQLNSEKEMRQKNDEDCAENEMSLPNSASMETEINVESRSNINDYVTQNSASKKVGFGVFANLDLDALNQRKPAEKSVLPVSKTKHDTEAVSALSDLKDDGQNEPEACDVYGPALPPNFANISVPETNTASLTKASSKKHGKSKSSHKHKHHKHKHKKKKKKSLKRNSSSDSSDDELEDIPPSLIIEKLKKLQRKKS